MQDLRLIGVHEDGAHVLLADAEGGRYRLALDESLRAAARRDRPRLGQVQIEIDGGARPRDVQAMIRAGLSAAEVAERSGWPVEKVHRYEVPILAEREHIAGLGRRVRLRQRGAASSGYGHAAAQTLEERVRERLVTRGVDPEHVSWDSWRREGTEWAVVAIFAAGGRQRQATWSFDVPTRSVSARDDEARWLSEDESSAPGEPRPAAPVYDVEADGGLQPPAERHRGPGRQPDPVDLMAAMRERSGARGRRTSGRRRLEPATLASDEVADVVPAGSTPRGPADADSGSGTAVAGRERADGTSHPEHRSGPGPADRLDQARADDPVGETAPDADSVTPKVATSEAEPVGAPPRAAVTLDDEGDGDAGSDFSPPTPGSPLPQAHGNRARARRDRARGSASPNHRAVGLAALFRSPAADQDDSGTVALDAPAQGDDTAATDEGLGDRPSRRRPGRTSVPSWDDIVLGTRTRDPQDG